jgi:hypothetical protein
LVRRLVIHLGKRLGGFHVCIMGQRRTLLASNGLLHAVRSSLSS